jgi:DNA-directed RNA polymerase specialized sigma24 family protein
MRAGPQGLRPDVEAAPCPCRRGDVAAEIAWQRPLLARAARGDRAAFGELYDAQVEGVYRYLLAWTLDRSSAMELTEQVFVGAEAWLEVIAGGEGELGVWLIAAARDAVAQRRGAGWVTGPGTDRPPPTDAPGAVAWLGDAEREVVVLRLLLGHSLAHTAHLSGYSERATRELQLAACDRLWGLTGGARTGAGPDATPRPDERRAGAFERQLARWSADLSGDDPALAAALAVASSLRAAAPGQVSAPDHAFVERLRDRLLAGGRGRQEARARVGPLGRAGGWLAGLRLGLSRRPWIATAVATSAIVAILGLQAFGGDGPAPACRGGRCPSGSTAPSGLLVVPPATNETLPAATSTTAPPETRPAPTTAPPATAAPPPPTAPATVPPTSLPPATVPSTSGRPTTTASTTTTTTSTSTTTTSTTTTITTTGTGGRA